MSRFAPSGRTMTSSTTSSATAGVLGSGKAGAFGDAVSPPLFAAYAAVNVKQHVPITLSLERPNFSMMDKSLYLVFVGLQHTWSFVGLLQGGLLQHTWSFVGLLQGGLLQHTWSLVGLRQGGFSAS
jgi:hypothetical protein